MTRDGLDERRVCQVYAHRRSRFGSGYLVRDGVVLCSRHVVSGGGKIEARLRMTDQWLPALQRPWTGRGSADAAVVTVPGLRAPGEVRLGRVHGPLSRAGRALGFPSAQTRDEQRLTEEINGEVAPLAAAEVGHLTFHVDRSVPDRDSSGRSPWEGVSGAALFCGELLVGVIRVEATHFGRRRLEAVPVAALAEDDEFCALLGIASPGALPAVEDEALRRWLLPAYYGGAIRGAAGFLKERTVPSLVLDPQRGVVPFRGRDTDLTVLHHWASGPGRARLALLTGAAGTGKTRLAAELSRILEAEGWVAGFVPRPAPTEPAKNWDPLDVSVSPVLLIVDEAQARQSELADLLVHLTHERAIPRTEPVRIVAIARDQPDWWDFALPERLTADVTAWAAHRDALKHELGAVADAGPQRSEAFMQASAAFAQLDVVPLPAAAPPDLSGPAFDIVLFIHLAAYTALLERGDRGLDSSDRLVRPGETVDPNLLIDFALRREARYWATSSGSLPTWIDEQIQRVAVMIATLAAPGSPDEVSRLLGASPRLGSQTEVGVRVQLSRWVAGLYSDREGRIRGLEPDILADALVASVSDKEPSLVPDLLGLATRDEAERCLLVLTRAAGTYASVRTALRDLLASRFESLAEAAADVTEQVGEPIASILAEVVAASGRSFIGARYRDPEEEVDIVGREVDAAGRLAARVLQLDPLVTGGLRKVALAVTRHELAESRALPESLAVFRDHKIAVSAYDHARWLDVDGRLSEALSVCEEALIYYRRLVEPFHDNGKYFLAIALSLHSHLLNKLERWRDAARSGNESLRLYRELDGEIVQPSSSGGWKDIAPLIAGLDTIMEPPGERATDRSGDLRRSFYSYSVDWHLSEPERLDWPVRQPEWRYWKARGEAVRVLVTALIRLDDFEATWPLLHEASCAFRPHVWWSDDARTGLAECLTNASQVCVFTGRPEDAHTIALAAVEFARAFATDDESRREAASLARALIHLSWVLGQQGRLAEALPAVQEAIGLWEGLTSTGDSEFFRKALRDAIERRDGLQRAQARPV